MKNSQLFEKDDFAEDCKDLYEFANNLKTKYWELSNKLMQASYSNSDYSMADARRLGQLAKAIGALSQARYELKEVAK